MSQGYGNPYERQTSYGQYGGNPYESEGSYGQGQSANPYGGGQSLETPQAQHGGLSHQTSTYSQDQYAGNAPGSAAQPNVITVTAPRSPPLSNQDFLTRVYGARKLINDLTEHVSSIATAHQRVFASTDPAASHQLESLTTQTQDINRRIKEDIRNLEVDAKRSQGNATKDSQVRSLKQSFKNQLEQFRKEESEYNQRYRDQIKRQARIVNPDANEEELNEAADRDPNAPGGIFSDALRSNRAGQVNSVLGSVTARHRDIQQIERTLIELNQLFQDLAEAVVVQEPAVQAAEEQTQQVKGDTEAANVHLTKGIKSARNARKLKWWCLGITVLIILIVALVVGLYFGVGPPSKN